MLTNVPFGAAAPYLAVPAGDYQVRVTPAGTKTVVIDSGALTLARGQVRTAIAVDTPGRGAAVRPAGLRRPELDEREREISDAQRLSTRGALLVLAATTAAEALEAGPRRFTIEGRGGFNVPTFDISDAVDGGPSVGVGLGYRLSPSLWALGDVDLGFHSGAEINKRCRWPRREGLSLHRKARLRGAYQRAPPTGR